MLGRMMVVFEVSLVHGADPENLLSAEILSETKAQVMTVEDARAVGFAGLPEPPSDKVVRLIAVAERDARWVQRGLETSEAVTSIRVHQVD
jgi:hypothetical protein